MKNIRYSVSFLLGAMVLFFCACTLEKEPDIPTGAGNEQKPIFSLTELKAITHDSVRARARLSFRGNLAILQYGWVWSEHSRPTLSDNKLEVVGLAVDSFEMLIPGLILGKTYYMRPYVVTGSGEIYGTEKTVTMDMPKLSDVVLVADSACFLRLRCNVQHSIPLTIYGIIYLVGEGTPTLQKRDALIPASGITNDDFQTDLTMLKPDTVYSVRAYAFTAAGIGYSRVLSVTTPSSSLITANFNVNTDTEIFQGADVLFSNTSVGASYYFWSFGDGVTSGNASPLHTFNTLGNMTVQLTAQNGGCILKKDTMLHVVADPFQDYWVSIPGGSFTMGCTPGQEPGCQSAEYPAHQVTLAPFFIGKTEITQGQYLAVTGNNPSYFYLCGDNCPIESASWERIMEEFMPALNRKTGRIHRLPTEAEWEYAARAGTDTKYAGSNNINLVGWYSAVIGGGGNGITHPVAQKMPNAYGLFDMTGNIDELCQDYYAPSYYSVSPSDNPTGPTAGTTYVLRGGGFITDSIYCRISTRLSFYPTTFASFVGFRLVRP